MKILFPLRCNAAHFASPETLEDLRRRLKRALLIYDEVVLEDGQFHFVVWEQGNMEFFMAPGAVPDARDHIPFAAPGQRSSFHVTNPQTGEQVPVLDGLVDAYYHADYLPMARESGLLDEGFLRLTYFAISEELKKHLQGMGSKDAADPQIRAALPDDIRQLTRMAQGLQIDSALGAYEAAALATDDRIGRLVAVKNRVMAQTALIPDIRDALLGVLCSVALPDPGGMGWQEVAGVRESAAGRDLRRHLAELADELTAELANIQDPRDAEIIMTRHVAQDLRDELIATMPGRGRMACDLLLNFSTVGGIVGSVAQLVNAVERRQNWVALLQRVD